MAHAPYDHCPCGSGRKLKFCCASLTGEMEKISRLRENKQEEAAQQALEKLSDAHPENAWVATTIASIHISNQKYEDAWTELSQLLESQPDHLLAIALLATAKLAAEGLENARPELYRAFQRCRQAYPDIISGLALGIAATMYANGRFMSARQHLALAMRFAPDSERPDIFRRLVEFDSNKDVAYPLRSVHLLEKLEEDDADDAVVAEAQKAAALAEIGCFGSAVTIYTKVIQEAEGNPVLWANLGISHAWEGDESAAAKALSYAAELTDDEDQAIEWESLAQLLQLNDSDACIKVLSRSIEIDSVSQILTQLDQIDRIVRVEVPDHEEMRRQGHRLPAGLFQVLDRSSAQLNSEEIDKLGIDDVPCILAQVSVFNPDEATQEPARLYITGQGDELSGEAERLLRESLGDALSGAIETDDNAGYSETIPEEFFGLQWRWSFPHEVPVIKQRELERAKWDQVISEVWFATPFQGLNGKSPQEATADPQLKVRLAAAVVVLDAFCDQSGYTIDRISIRQRLGLPEETRIDATNETPLKSYSSCQMMRLNIESLTDEQISTVLNRALLTYHGGFLYPLLQNVLTRPAVMNRLDLNRIYTGMVEMARDRYDREACFHWLEKGKEQAKTTDKPFENQLQWEMRELATRLEDPQDPKLSQLLSRMWDYYGQKLPDLRDYLIQLVRSCNITPPWEGGGDSVGTGDGQTAVDGIWVPGGETPEENSENKLWVPGQ